MMTALESDFFLLVCQEDEDIGFGDAFSSFLNLEGI